MTGIETLGDLRCEFGESPVWDDRRACLFCCDVHAGAIHAIYPESGKVAAWRFGHSVGSFGLAGNGWLVVALRSAVVLFDPDGGETIPLLDFAFECPDVRLNDGKVGPDGAFWIGSVHEVGFDLMQRIGALFRVAPDGSFTVHVDELKASNGLAWAGDGKTMFHSDSCGPWIDRYDFDPATGAMSNRSRIAELQEADGRPDGGAVDLDGNYWSAGTSAGVLNKFSSDGALLTKIHLPVPKPTMPCFGGPDMKTLFVTSRRDMLDANERDRFPLSGAVLTLRVDVPGVPVGRFA